MYFAIWENDANSFKFLINLGKLFTGLKKLSELNLNFLVPLLSEMEADQLLSWEVKPGGPVPVEQNVACLDAMSAWFHHHLGLN